MAERILLIEDDKRLAGMIRDFLDMSGFRVTSAQTGSEALEMEGRETYDAVVLYLMLPDMDGLDICRQIRAHATTPILMLTARGDAMDRIIGLELGADDYLPPCSARSRTSSLEASPDVLIAGLPEGDEARRREIVRRTAFSLRGA